MFAEMQENYTAFRERIQPQPSLHLLNSSEFKTTVDTVSLWTETTGSSHLQLVRDPSSFTAPLMILQNTNMGRQLVDPLVRLEEDDFLRIKARHFLFFFPARHRVLTRHTGSAARLRAPAGSLRVGPWKVLPHLDQGGPACRRRGAFLQYDTFADTVCCPGSAAAARGQAHVHARVHRIHAPCSETLPRH